MVLCFSVINNNLSISHLLKLSIAQNLYTCTLVLSFLIYILRHLQSSTTHTRHVVQVLSTVIPPVPHQCNIHTEPTKLHLQDMLLSSVTIARKIQSCLVFYFDIFISIALNTNKNAVHPPISCIMMILVQRANFCPLC